MTVEEFMESFELNIYGELSATTVMQAYLDIKVQVKDEEEEKLELERSFGEEDSRDEKDSS